MFRGNTQEVSNLMDNEQYNKLRTSLIINRILLIIILIILLAIIGAIVYITKAVMPYVEGFTKLMDLLSGLDVSAINDTITDVKDSIPNINELGGKINTIVDEFNAFTEKFSPILSFFGK